MVNLDTVHPDVEGRMEEWYENTTKRSPSRSHSNNQENQAMITLIAMRALNRLHETDRG